MFHLETKRVQGRFLDVHKEVWQEWKLLDPKPTYQIGLDAKCKLHKFSGPSIKNNIHTAIWAPWLPLNRYFSLAAKERTEVWSSWERVCTHLLGDTNSAAVCLVMLPTLADSEVGITMLQCSIKIKDQRSEWRSVPKDIVSMLLAKFRQFKSKLEVPP